MNDSDDQGLRELFTRLREEERQLTPAFRLPSLRPSPAPSAMLFRRLLPVSIAGIILTMLMLTKNEPPKRSLSTLPTLLARDGKPTSLFNSLPHARPSLPDLVSESATDFLLPAHLKLRIL